MLAVSKAKHPNIDKGVAAWIDSPEVDSAKTDSSSILAVDLSKIDDGCFKIASKTCILKQLYTKF